MKYFILLYLSSFFHAGHSAEFHYQLDENGISLEFLIEHAEVLSFAMDENCDLKNMTALCVSQYLKKHSSVFINGKKLHFELQKSRVEDGHLLIQLSSQWESETIKELKVENECFFEFNSKFKNRIIWEVGSSKKSYLFTKKKNGIHLLYKNKK